MAPLVTIAETPEFVRRVAKLLSQEEQMALLEYLAANPQAGDLIQRTGGVRKLRWARGGRGKSAGVRVIYYFYSHAMPLYLLTVYGKNQRADLTAAERDGFANVVRMLKATTRSTS